MDPQIYHAVKVALAIFGMYMAGFGLGAVLRLMRRI